MPNMLIIDTYKASKINVVHKSINLTSLKSSLALKGLSFDY